MMKCLHWKICITPLNQSFPNDQCTFEKNHAWLTNPFKMQDRPIVFNATVCEKFTDIISFSTLQ